MDCKKKCKIKRVGALRVQIAKKKWKIKEGWGIKGQVECGLQKKVKIKRVGALRRGWRVDCAKKVQN